MDFSKLSMIFKFAILAIVYLIIFFALRIMYKDIKSGGRKKVSNRKGTFGLEVIEAGENTNLKNGGIIPVQGELTIGRKNTNHLILEDQFVSGNHARIFVKNTDYIIEDMGSTNGTKLNDERLEDRAILRVGDEIQIGSTLFRVIG
ncbi:FHA domain-containing protein [Clostridium sp. YIM B02515]|uniref:FHA domain-containing protein n=1 Tax=Clostridium rhizosphaerae TaxID=2803861 RepID=A0ABS1TAD7_9CLOT|nr:FHA domain-containing protein [Clostridium rhizosphaerae]MBL4936300.1 FHA domain-containing protein [Clostridium rhizosphaerae]